MNQVKKISLLVIGIITMILSNGKFLMWWAAFLFPIALLLSYDDNRKVRSIILLLLATTFANGISFFNMLPDVGIPFLKYLPFMAGTTAAIPFILQLRAFEKSQKFIATLILPATYALMDSLNASFNPFGSFGVLGYSQHGNLPFAQLASVVGVIGLTFFITWFGSIVVWMIKNKKFKREAAVFIVISCMILAFGLYRLQMDKDTDFYQVSGIHTLDRTIDETANLFSSFNDNRENFEAVSLDNLHHLLNLSHEEVNKGAEVISHAEATIVVSQTSKNKFLNILSEFAIKHEVMLISPMYVITEADEKDENVLYIIDTDGKIVLEHYKYGGNMFENSMPGDKILKSVDSDYGKLSAIICWDKDFPNIVSQVGRMKTDTLFIPSADWKEISPYHTIIGTFRGLENGANVVTQTINGMSMIVNYKGQILSEMDHFETSKWVMSGKLPVKGSKTIYPYIQKWMNIFIFLMTIVPWWLIKKEV